MKKKLRSGFTTGACASAATKIALLCIKKRKKINEPIKVWFPNDKYFSFKAFNIKKIDENYYEVIIKKFAGDDPDITDGALIGSRVKFEDSDCLEINITGGEGVGKVTKPGLPVNVGEYAINPGPRMMIEKNIKEVINKGRLDVEIFVVNGEKLAEKTLNKKLGIIGGISILGTTGIVKPISTQAWLDTIKIEMNVARANGVKDIVIVTGRTTENILKKNFNYPEEAYISVGDHIGFSLKEAVNRDFNKIIFGGMFGKFTKIASGEFKTHVKNSTLFFNKLIEIAENIENIDEKFIEIIKNSITARNVFEEAKKRNYFDFIQKVCDIVCDNCFNFINKKKPILTILVDYNGKIIAKSFKS